MCSPAPVKFLVLETESPPVLATRVLTREGDAVGVLLGDDASKVALRRFETVDGTRVFQIGAISATDHAAVNANILPKVGEWLLPRPVAPECEGPVFGPVL